MNEWITFSRAQRVLAPAVGAINHERLFDLMVAGHVRVRAVGEPPRLPASVQPGAFPSDWFGYLRNPEVATVDGGRKFVREWNAWLAEGGLEVSRSDVEAHRDSILAEGVPRAFVAAGRWTLAQATAWIASKDDQLSLLHDGGFGGRRIIRVRYEVSKRFCECGAHEDGEAERWERCNCAEVAFNQLRCAMLDTSRPLRAWNRPASPIGTMPITNDWQRPGDELEPLSESNAAALDWPMQFDGLLKAPEGIDRVEFEESDIRHRFHAQNIDSPLPDWSDEALLVWIGSCGHSNYKHAWADFRAHQIGAQLVKYETFVGVWNRYHRRGRGRPSK